MTQDFEANRQGRMSARQLEQVTRTANLHSSNSGTAAAAFENLFGETSETVQKHDTFLHTGTQSASALGSGAAAGANIGQKAMQSIQEQKSSDSKLIDNSKHNLRDTSSQFNSGHLAADNFPTELRTPIAGPASAGINIADAAKHNSRTNLGQNQDMTGATHAQRTVAEMAGVGTLVNNTTLKDGTENKKKAEDKDKTEKNAETDKRYTKADIKKEKVTKNGDVTTTVRTFKDGTKQKITQDGDKITTISYNANGVRTNKVVKEGEGDNAKISTVTYNKDGKPEEKIVKNGDKKSDINFDKDGKKINKTVTQGEGDNKVVSTAQYDPKTGNVTARTKEGLVEGNNVSVAKQYDPKTGKLTSKITETTTPAGTTSKEQVAYEYDKDGNMTKRAATDNYGHITTSLYSDYTKGKDGTMTRNVAITITTATGNQIGDVVYKEQSMNEAGKITSSNWFSDAEHKNKTKDVQYTYDENNVKQSAIVISFDKDGNKIRETTQNNFQKTTNGTTYDSVTKTYEQAADGTIKEVIVTRPKIKYFNGVTYFLNDEFDKKEYTIGARHTKAEEETGEAEDVEDTEDTGKAAVADNPAVDEPPKTTGTNTPKEATTDADDPDDPNDIDDKLDHVLV